MIACRQLGVLVVLLYSVAAVNSQVAGPYGEVDTVNTRSKRNHAVKKVSGTGSGGIRKPTAAERAKALSEAIDAHLKAAATAKCSAGKFFVNGRCTNCPKGTFRKGDTADATTCTKCLAPYSTSATGSTSPDDCNVCPPGYGTPRSGAACICAPCAKGYYSAGGPVQLCTRCSPGRTTKAAKSTSKSDCSLKAPPPPSPMPGGSRCFPGFRYDKHSGCVPCPAGQFRGLNSTDDTTCTKCYYAYAYTTRGLATSGQSCSSCKPGFGPPPNGPSCLCTACPTGSYSGGPSSVAGGTPPNGNTNLPCIPCPVGYTTNKTSSKNAPADITACVPINPALVPTQEAQRDILLQGKAELLGPNNSGSQYGLQTWKAGTNICTWSGIACLGGSPQGLVTDINIGSETMNGKLPVAWTQAALATTLQSLSISFPAAGSTLSDTTIPGSWSSFSSLKTLRLSGFNLTGPLPTNWPLSIQRIILDNNKFTGTVPESYSQLPYLVQLDLSNNQLSGQLPIHIAEAAQLMFINLGGNLFTDPLPAEWGALSSVVAIIVNNNKHTGGVPTSWYGFTNLYHLDISYNQLTELPGATFWTSRSRPSDLPSNYNWRSTLGNFIADGNLFSGTLPDYISAWVPSYPKNYIQGLQDGYYNFNTLGLSNNGVTGGLPLSWQNISAYMLIDLSNNHLTGPLPNEAWAHVTLVDLSDNQLTGTLPESWKDMRLFFLDVSRNQLNGPLPAAWNDWQSDYYFGIGDILVKLFVSGNPLNCPIPSQWSSWDTLQTFFADSCGLTGTIPSTWSDQLLTVNGFLKDKELAIFDNPSLGGCVHGNFTNMWGPVTSSQSATQAGTGWYQGYALYDWKTLNSQTQPQDWPPLSGTNITKWCTNGSTMLTASGYAEPPVPDEP